MLKFNSCFILSFLFVTSLFGQEKEIVPPFNIKTVTFVQNDQNAIPLFSLDDSFQLQFDDLFGDESNYYYQIVHCDYDWKPSQLSKSEYLQGFDDQRIQEYTNSFNTLQMYSHYKLSLPNKFTKLMVSGNYMLKILNEAREVVFTRKFILFENLVEVPIQVKRARNVKDLNFKQNIDFAIKSQTLLFQSPIQNVKVLIMQNGQLNSAITNIKPMYTMGNDLIYKYDAETQFWGGNEFMFFENKNIRAANNSIASVDSKDIYNSHLYLNLARASKPYTYYPDINGNFIVKNLNATNNEVEADYAWVYFSVSSPTYYGKKDVYVTGMFNNYGLSPENKMDYNEAKGIYEKALNIKQGFTNYQYTIADTKGVIDNENAFDGNFWQTENNYFVIVYYRENGQRYDRVIGKGVATSTEITN
jgi:hypothetical protein